MIRREYVDGYHMAQDTDCCGHCNEPSGSIQGREFREQWSDSSEERLPLEVGKFDRCGLGILTSHAFSYECNKMSNKGLGMCAVKSCVNVLCTPKEHITTHHM
jgi:hypothetical protein